MSTGGSEENEAVDAMSFLNTMGSLVWKNRRVTWVAAEKDARGECGGEWCGVVDVTGMFWDNKGTTLQWPW